MTAPVSNQRRPGGLTEADIGSALVRIGARDPDRGSEASHVFDTSTWGAGPAVINRSGAQDWLWYRLPTKYMTNEVGYAGRLAGVAAELFDELGLDAYAALCRDPDTASVHEVFERSDRDGFAAMRRAVSLSGIGPPDLDDLAWGAVMGIEEVGAHAAEHPAEPGQTWRAAVMTERIGTWVDGAARRCDALARLRAGVAKHLLHPVATPPDLAERLAPMLWLRAAASEPEPESENTDDVGGP